MRNFGGGYDSISLEANGSAEVKDAAENAQTEAEADALSELPVMSFKDARSGKSGFYEYQYNSDGQACITKYIGSEEDVVIPSELDGYPVVKIGDYAFQNNTKIHTLVMPDTVRKIGKRAFSSCKKLEKITLSENLEEIGLCAFLGCSSLSSVTIPKSIKQYGFDYDLDYYPFSDCDNLKTIVFEEGTSWIPECFVYGCTSLEEVQIPDSVTEIGINAFHGCTGLEKVQIPDSVTEIGNCAFYGCENLKTVEMSKNLQTLGDYAFYNCKSLESIVIPDATVYIGLSCFEGCTSLKNVSLGTGITEISDGCFWGCKKLEEFVVPYRVKKIAGFYYDFVALQIGSFEGCINLTKLTLPRNLNSCDNAFKDLRVSLYGPAGSYAQQYAISHYYPFVEIDAPATAFSLQSDALTVEADNDQTIIFSLVPADCTDEIVWQSSDPAVATVSNDGILHAIAPGTVTVTASIPEREFTDTCTVTVTETEPHTHTMEEIAATASTCTENGHETYFQCSGCGKLYSDKSGDNEISLADVLLPKLWHGLGETWDTGDLTHHWKICSTCGEKGEIRAHTYDYVPADESADGKAYRKCSVCGKEVHEESSGDTPGGDTPGGETGGDTPGGGTGGDTPGGETGGDTPGSGIGGTLSGNVKWNYEDGTLTLSGTGAASWTSEQDKPWESYDIQKIIIPQGITAIGDYLFQDMENLTEVSIADTVTVIGDFAFSGCENLVRIQIPEGVTEIGLSAFSGCKSLTQIRIPESVTSIASWVFWGCNNLADITLPGHLTYIGDYILKDTKFSNDASNWKDGVLYYGKYLLDADEDLSGSYTILDGTELIAARAFIFAEDLVSVRVPRSVKYIGWDAMGIGFVTAEPIPGFKIFCYAGSAAEAYAIEYGVAYELIAEEEQPGGAGGDTPGGGAGTGGTPGSGSGSDIPGGGSGGDTTGDGSGSGTPGSGTGSDIPGGGAGGATPSGSTGSTAPGTPAGAPKTADSLLRFWMMFLLFVSSLAGTGVVLYNYLRRIY